MGSIATQMPQLEKPLKELWSAHDVIKAGIGLVSTAELNLGHLYGPGVTSAVSYSPDQMILLCKINEDNAIMLNGVVYLTTLKNDTGAVANWPVGTEFKDIATDACKEFCNSHGLLGILRRCLNQTRVVFSNIAHLSAELDYFRDEGVEDSTHVVIRVKVKSNQKAALEEYDAWVNWVIQNISPDDCNFFTLTVQRI
jgi:hypothetical protein